VKLKALKIAAPQHRQHRRRHTRREWGQGGHSPACTLSEPNSLAIKLSGVPIILASSANEVVSEMQLPPTATHRVECAGATEGSKLRRRENI